MDPDPDFQIVERAIDPAAMRGVAPGQVALGWMLRQPGITAPIVDVTCPDRLEQALDAVQVQLAGAERAMLEQPCPPYPVLDN